MLYTSPHELAWTYSTANDSQMHNRMYMWSDNACTCCNTHLERVSVTDANCVCTSFSGSCTRSCTPCMLASTSDIALARVVLVLTKTLSISKDACLWSWHLQSIMAAPVVFKLFLQTPVSDAELVKSCTNNNHTHST